MPRDTHNAKGEKEEECSEGRIGPLIVWVLLIHKDAINSTKSRQWMQRDADSETRSCSRKTIDPRTPGKFPGELHHADQSLIVCPSAGALQQTSNAPKPLTHSQQLPAGRLRTSLCRIDQLLEKLPLAPTFCSLRSAAEQGNADKTRQLY